MPESTVTNQITSGATNQAAMLVICSPFVNSIVSMSETSVVMSAMPPRNAGMYLTAILKTNGDSKMCARVKNPTLTKNPNPLIEKSGSKIEAIKRPSALPSNVRADYARNRSIYSPSR